MLTFRGVIRNLRYQPQVGKPLQRYELALFDINTAPTSGVVYWETEENNLGYSKWVSPKRTRSYPFERIYNTYHLPKKVTIIPVIKDEGAEGDCDRINFMTLSWMNLLNVYIILAWYDRAIPHRKLPNKISQQQFDVEYVRGKLWEISHYHQTALHWNLQHFEQDFEPVYHRAIQSYQRIAAETSIRLHSDQSHLRQLADYQQDGKFNPQIFRKMSLEASYGAAQRELVTRHALERLADGDKAYFSITNYLGGAYHLTADEVYWEGDRLIIQESKNAQSRFPSLSDIKDGLFKLILFANLESLYWNEQAVHFSPRLKITGAFVGNVALPVAAETLQTFWQKNGFSRATIATLQALNQEAQHNPPLEIHLKGNL